MHEIRERAKRATRERRARAEARQILATNAAHGETEAGQAPSP
jgi:hypothetical protein